MKYYLNISRILKSSCYIKPFNQGFLKVFLGLFETLLLALVANSMGIGFYVI